MSLSDPFSKVIPYTLDKPLQSVGSGIYVWADGNLNFTAMDGTVVGTVAVVAGQLIPFRVKQINTGTTAGISIGWNG